MHKIKSIINRWFNEKEQFAFLFLTVLIYALIYLPIPINHKMYIYLDIGSDTYSSYWPLYGFLWDYVRQPIWTQWSFQMGLGNSIASSIMFLFDPYNLFILPFSKYNIDSGIFLALTAKVFSLAALAFAYLKRIGYRGAALIASALAYTFCGYFVGWGQHYHFATAFIFFTFILLTLEIWLQTKKWHWLVLSVSIMAIFSVYFLFMSLLFLSFYYIVRFIQLREWGWIVFLKHGFVTIFLIFSGISLAAFSLLPQVYVLMQSPRVGAGVFPSVAFASINEYVTIIARLLSNNLLNLNSYFGYGNFYESPFLYTGMLTLVMLVPLFFLKNKCHSVIFLSVLFCLLFPGFSNPLFNGFSAYTYRWTFVLVPVMTNGLASGLEALNRVPLQKAGYVVLATCIVMISIYGGDVLVESQRLDRAARISLIGVVFFLLIYSTVMLVGKMKIETLQRLFVFALAGELSLMGYVAVNIRSLVESPAKPSYVPYFNESTTSALSFIQKQDDGFYRVNKLYDYIHLTDALYQDFYGEKYYSSTIPVHIWELQELFGLRGAGSNYLYGFLDSQSLRDISSVKYMFSKDHASYVGYDYMTQVGNVYVYMNKHALPFGFVYDQYISMSDFKNLSIVEREDIIYDVVILPDDITSMPGLEKVTAPPTNYDTKKNDLNLADSLGFLLEDGQLMLKPLKKQENGPPYINLSFGETSKSSIYVYFSALSEERGILEVSYKTEKGGFNLDNVYIFNVFEGENHYLITIPAIGVNELRIASPRISESLILSDFSVVERNDKEVEQKVSELQQQAAALDLVFVSEDYIKGALSLEKAGFLYFSIPYDEGWRLYVDGVRVELVKANIAFMGARIPPGQHSFELRYSTPLFFEGRMISCVFLLVLIIVSAFEKIFNIRLREKSE